MVIGGCFYNLSEFQAWKESLEDSEDCLFIKNTGAKRLGESKVEYFNCNRGGDYVTKGTGKRKLKSQGIGCGLCCLLFNKNNFFLILKKYFQTVDHFQTNEPGETVTVTLRSFRSAYGQQRY